MALHDSRRAAEQTPSEGAANRGDRRARGRRRGLLGAATLGLVALLYPGVAAAVVTLPAGIGKNIKTDYGAAGDGVTDDTAAIQKALSDGRVVGKDYYGLPKLLVFPPGTYLVSKTLTEVGNSVLLQGSGSDVTTILVQDKAAAFASAASPAPVIVTDTESPVHGNTAFHDLISDLTVDTGHGNPGAVGIDFIVSNMGAVRNVVIRSGDGAGVAGLDMTRQWPGPGLIDHLEVDGFDVGIRVSEAEYSMTFEHILLKGQNVAGLSDDANILAIRDLTSSNSVPAIQVPAGSDSSMIDLVDATLQGGSPGGPAIDMGGGSLYLRNVTATGYANAFSYEGTANPGGYVSEYISSPAQTLFPSPARSLGLPVQETPSYEDTTLADWATCPIDANGYCAPAKVQTALDSGATTLYFAGGQVGTCAQVFMVPKGVRRIVGYGTYFNAYCGTGSGYTFVVSEASTDPLIIEQFTAGVSVSIEAARAVVLKDIALDALTDAAGATDLFLEDVDLGAIALQHVKRVWARQFNLEGSQLKITNAASDFWILGVKSEGYGTMIETSGTGRTELLGGLLYPVQTVPADAGTASAFINNDGCQSLIYGTSAYNPNSNYPVQVTETRAGVTRQLTVPFHTGRYAQPLFVGCPAASFPAQGSGGMDGGAMDAGAMDSGLADSGLADSGLADSGAKDSGATDSGVTDSGSAGSGAADGGIKDGGATSGGAAAGGAGKDGGVDASAGSGGSGNGGASASGEEASPAGASGGCGCTTASGAAGGAWTFLSLALSLSLRRRRSQRAR